MAEYTNYEKAVALGYEGSRGTEATELQALIPCDLDSNIDFGPEFEEDEKIRGVKSRFAPEKTGDMGEGSITGVPVEPETIGYFLHSLFGSVSSVETVPGTVYTHTFSAVTGLQKPSYSIVFDRDVNKKAYLLSVIGAMSLSIPTAGKLVADFDIICKNEADSTLSLPSIIEPNPFDNIDTGIYIADKGSSKPGSPNGEIVEMSLSFSDDTFGKDTINQSALVQDVVSPTPPEISGSFTIHFTDADQRDNFLGGVEQAIWIECIGGTIDPSNDYKLEIELFNVTYKAYPYDDVDGVLASAVEFDAYYSVSDGGVIEADLVNTIAEYGAVS